MVGVVGFMADVASIAPKDQPRGFWKKKQGVVGVVGLTVFCFIPNKWLGSRAPRQLFFSKILSKSRDPQKGGQKCLFGNLRISTKNIFLCFSFSKKPTKEVMSSLQTRKQECWQGGCLIRTTYSEFKHVRRSELILTAPTTMKGQHWHNNQVSICWLVHVCTVRNHKHTVRTRDFTALVFVRSHAQIRRGRHAC